MSASLNPKGPPVDKEGDQATVPRIEAYQTDGGTVIFDGENPLAWVYSNEPVPIKVSA